MGPNDPEVIPRRTFKVTSAPAGFDTWGEEKSKPKKKSATTKVPKGIQDQIIDEMKADPAFAPRKPDYILKAKFGSVTGRVGAAWKSKAGAISITLDPFVCLQSFEGLRVTLFPNDK